MIVTITIILVIIIVSSILMFFICYPWMRPKTYLFTVSGTIANYEYKFRYDTELRLHDLVG